MVVWIEITPDDDGCQLCVVTTCVVVWIEIQGVDRIGKQRNRHHLRGGVD